MGTGKWPVGHKDRSDNQIGPVEANFMSDIQHHQFTDFLRRGAVSSLPAVYLIHGQEMLVEQSTMQLVNKLLDGAEAQICCEKVDGVMENLPGVLERMNTYALLSGPKIVIFKEAKLFEGKANPQAMAERIADAWDANDMNQAAKQFWGLCGGLDIDPDSARHGHMGNDALKALHGRLGTEVIQKMVDYGHSKGWMPSASGDPLADLQRAIKNGFPQGHSLIVTVHSKVPKNLKLYKNFRDHGAVIDCNIPQGERRSDKAAQEAVLRHTLEELLAAADKHMSPGAFQYLCRYTGFDPRTFAQNVEKLIDYAGENKEISEEDIHAVVKRTKSDPVFELTSAVADRNLSQALFYAQALLGAKWHPLQVLSALANQMRKLLIAKSFAAGSYGTPWVRGMAYSQFQSTVMPAVIAHDKAVRDQSKAWQDTSGTASSKKPGGKKKGGDIVLAANPKSPYPVYQTLLKSEKFSLEELTGAIFKLSRADLRLKSSGQDHTLVLKRLIMDICGRPSRNSS